MGVSMNPLVGREECTRQLARLRVARSASVGNPSGRRRGFERRLAEARAATRRRATGTPYVRAALEEWARILKVIVESPTARTSAS